MMPLTKAALAEAEGLAAMQSTLEKKQQVYLNALAVWVVKDYLELIRVSTEIAAGDSWNPVVCLSADVADLVVTGVTFSPVKSCDYDGSFSSSRIKLPAS